jgi:hypothetical protein
LELLAQPQDVFDMSNEELKALCKEEIGSFPSWSNRFKIATALLQRLEAESNPSLYDWISEHCEFTPEQWEALKKLTKPPVDSLLTPPEKP